MRVVLPKFDRREPRPHVEVEVTPPDIETFVGGRRRVLAGVVCVHPDQVIADPAQWEREVPHALFAWLREHEPMSWHEDRRRSATTTNVAFGRGGPPCCLGAHLARLEIRVLFRALLDHVGGMALASEPCRLRSDHLDGVVSLPLTLTPR